MPGLRLGLLKTDTTINALNSVRANAGLTAFEGYDPNIYPKIAKTTSASIDVDAEKGSLFTDDGAASIITLTLPTPSDGDLFRFLVVDGSGIRIKAAAGDSIFYGTEKTNTGGAVSSTTIGSFIELIAAAGDWYATGIVGSWQQLPTDSMLLRFQADSLFDRYADGDSIALWLDESGNKNHGTQPTAGSQPTLNKGGGGNGHDSVTFDGAADRIDLIDFSAESLSAAEAFLVVKLDTDPPGSIDQCGLWDIGSDSTANLYPFTDSVIYDGFGSTARKTTVDPTPALTSWRVYSVYSAASDWQNYLDGTSLHSTGTNTVGFKSGTAYLAEDSGTHNLDGEISEFVVYSKKLSADERTDATDYLKNKYAI